jgi:hypothetical protein
LATLCELAHRTHLGADSFSTIPPLPHRELACLSGLARETTSRILSKRRQRGIVKEVESGGLKIVNLRPYTKGNCCRQNQPSALSLIVHSQWHRQRLERIGFRQEVV